MSLKSDCCQFSLALTCATSSANPVSLQSSGGRPEAHKRAAMTLPSASMVLRISDSAFLSSVSV